MRFTRKSSKDTTDIDKRSNFTQYGINRRINNQNDLKGFSHKDIAKCSIISANKLSLNQLRQRIRFENPIFLMENRRFKTVDEYDVSKERRSGGYGKVYHVEDEESGKRFAVKCIFVETNEMFTSIILEALANIILFEDSKKLADGPYVQEFFHIAYDPETNCVCFRLQYLPYTLTRYFWYVKTNKLENDLIIPTYLLDIIHYLKYFDRKFQMNHRDVKSNNLMVNLHEDRPIFVDFGFVCMKWKGLTINAYKSFRKCVKKGRDMTFLISEILASLEPYISQRLRDTLKPFASVNFKNRICKLYKINDRCDASHTCAQQVGCYEIADFHKVYDFLDRDDVDLKSPEVLEVVLKKFLETVSRRSFKQRQRWTKQTTPHFFEVSHPPTRRKTRRSSSRRKFTTSKRQTRRNNNKGY